MTPPAFTDRRRSLLGLIAVGLATSAASVFLPQAPGLLGDISRILFGAAAGSAFLAAAYLAVLLSMKDTTEPVQEPVPADEPAPIS
jgi:hypothetical protein